MTEAKKMIGENIICGKSGIGEIIEIASLQEGGEEFYKVSFPKDKCVNYFSMTNQSNYRIVSTDEVVNKAVDIFKSKFDKGDYATIQEKINSQKELLKEDDICKLAKTLSILNDETELHPQITKPFKDSLSCFIDELAFVLNMKKTEVNSLLGIKLPEKKVKKARK